MYPWLLASAITQPGRSSQSQAHQGSWYLVVGTLRLKVAEVPAIRGEVNRHMLAVRNVDHG